MGFMPTRRVIEREDRFVGWVSRCNSTGRVRSVNHLSFGALFHTPNGGTVIDERPARMPQEAHFRTPGPESADPCFPPKNADLMYTGFNVPHLR